jgi:3-phosphoinositide dependent protein kinase-1
MCLTDELFHRLYYTFQDPNYLYLCMEIAKGGELRRLINNFSAANAEKGIERTAFPESMTRFYAAEMLESLRYLHESGVFHRDLKPENVLISESGHIKLADFGTALVESEAGSSPEDPSRNSFVGTAEYVSPEVLGDEDATKACDLWALGCIIYQMLTGESPFRAASEYLIFNKILAHCDGSEPLTFPESVSPNARDLINGLLVGDVSQRFGAGPPGSSNSFEALVNHPFFTSEDGGPAVVASIDLCKETPPYIPDSSTFPPVDAMIDGASDEWLTEGDATPITSDHKSKHLPYGEGADLPRISEESESLAAESVKDPKKAQFWDPLLKPGEEHVFSSVVWKRKVRF